MASYRVQSDLIIPHKKVLLERDDIVSKMDTAFTSGIKTIALVGVTGIGGAGKTVLARYYAAFVSNSKIVWELNAEKKETLMHSFQDLAWALTQKNSARKKELDAVISIQNTEEKQKQLLLLIKAWLKEEESWFLIFDNVENIADIKDYIPQDQRVWGSGRVIITTRNTNIQTTEFLTDSDVILVEELTDYQKLMLFCKIYYNKMPDRLTLQEKQQTIGFLKSIPPFPLDVSSTAYYLQSTNTSFEQYLKNLRNPSMTFEHAQEALLKERGPYTKTRYGIITMCLQRILDAHPEFTDLALFISLLDSQNIPKALLESYRHVDEFIIHLKKYAFITRESSSAQGPTFSLHKSTQSIMLAYLTQKLDLRKHKESLTKISDLLENYMSMLLDKEDYWKCYALLNHYEIFLSHDIITEDIYCTFGTVLGAVYCNLERYNIQTKELLEKSLQGLEKYAPQNIDKKALALSYLGTTTRYLENIEKGKDLLAQSVFLYENNKINHIGAAKSMGYLGDVYRILGNYDQSEMLLKKSINIYQQHEEHKIGYARVLAYLGLLYRDLGAHEKARDLLERSIEIHKKTSGHVSIAFSITCLGSVYRELGNYEKAQEVIKQSLAIYEKYHFEKYSPYNIGWTNCHLAIVCDALGYHNKAKLLFEKGLAIKGIDSAWVSVFLGNVYRGLGEYDKAKETLEKSLSFYQKTYGPDHVYTGVNLLYLGRVYSALGDYEKAKEVLEKGLAIYIRHYGADHIHTIRYFNALGQAYMLKTDMFEEAERIIKKAKEFLQKENHPDLMFTYELLGDLYAKKSETDKSIDYYKQALAVGQTFLKKDSAHMIRLHKKLS